MCLIVLSTQMLKVPQKHFIQQIKQYLAESGETQKIKIRKWADNLKRLYEIGKSDVPIDQISGHIAQVASTELHWNESQLAYIRKCLDEEFKDSSKANVGSSDTSIALENLNVVPGDVLKSLDDEQLRQFIKVQGTNEDHALFEARDRGLAIVDHSERRPKEETNPSTPGKSESYYAGDDVLKEGKLFIEEFEGVVSKIFDNPPKDKQQDREIATKIRSLAVMFSGFRKLLP